MSAQQPTREQVGAAVRSGVVVRNHPNVLDDITDAVFTLLLQPTPVGPQPRLVKGYPMLTWTSDELCYLAADGSGWWKVEAMPKVTR